MMPPKMAATPVAVNMADASPEVKPASSSSRATRNASTRRYMKPNAAYAPVSAFQQGTWRSASRPMNPPPVRGAGAVLSAGGRSLPTVARRSRATVATSTTTAITASTRYT